MPIIQKDPKPLEKGETPSFTLVYREFGGMNVQASRQAIPDDDFYWLENFIPIGDGNLPVVAAPTYKGITQTNRSAILEVIANISNVDYIFTFFDDGSATYIPDTEPYVSHSLATAGTFSAPDATAYPSGPHGGGLLIIDPNGYFDYNLTVASTLTTISAMVNGTQIAVYATRVWIANGRVISFTDVNSYTSFAGAGGSLTIQDPYLHNKITSLISANGFLYIFGDNSIDVLGNVTVSAGVTSFTRTNITASIGTSYPNSVFPYYRSVAFAGQSGFYLLSGASPQKISSPLDSFFLAGTFQASNTLPGAPCVINGNQCAAWSISIVDTFSGVGGMRSLVCCYFDGKWFVGNQGAIVAMASTIVGGSPTLHGWTAGPGSQLFHLFDNTALVSLTALLKTKLWDGGQPILNKQMIRAGVGILYSGSGSVAFTTDNEYGSQPLTLFNLADFIVFINNNNGVLQFQNNSGQNLNFTTAGYQLVSAAGATNNGKTMGLTLETTTTQNIVQLAALEFKESRRW